MYFICLYFITKSYFSEQSLDHQLIRRPPVPPRIEVRNQAKKVKELVELRRQQHQNP
jgi:hypothetical protein